MFPSESPGEDEGIQDTQDSLPSVPADVGGGGEREITSPPDHTREIQGILQEIKEYPNPNKHTISPHPTDKPVDDSVLTPQQKEDVEEIMKRIVRKPHYNPLSLFTGNPTALEYGGKARSFSTWTSIAILSDGRKVFIIHNYPFSRFHRTFDNLLKRWGGTKMQKASMSEWVETFQKRSNIPVLLADEEKNIIVLPFIPNVNLYDLMANNHEIDDWGECADWASSVTLERKKEIALDVMQEVKRIHEQDITWGEMILPNVILTKEKKIIIVDPETEYSKDVPIEEQKARDIRDIIISICGALFKSEKFQDYESIAREMLSKYGDTTVIQYLKENLCGKEKTKWQAIRLVFSLALRLSIPPEECRRVLKALQNA